MEFKRITDLLRRFIFTKNLTTRKFVNLCLIIFQHVFTKNSRVIGYPIELVIDPCNICNLHCPLCPTGQGRKNRSMGKMSFDNFIKIIDELGAYLYKIDLHNWGEPLLNEKIYDMIDYARKHKIGVNLSTNLNYFDAEKIVESGLDHLIVSLDGTNQETYEKYRVGGDFNKVINGIKMIIQKKKELNSSKPSITWQFLLTKHNEHEIPRASKMAKDLGVDLDIVCIQCDMGRGVFWNIERRIKETEKLVPHDHKYKISILKPCNYLWVQASINWDGSVSPCCATYPQKYDFGNMFNEGGFIKVWNNETYKAARRIIRQKKIAGIDDMKNICAHCFINSRRNSREGG